MNCTEPALLSLGHFESFMRRLCFNCTLFLFVENVVSPISSLSFTWFLGVHEYRFFQALLEYEKNKLKNGELPFSDGPLTESMRAENQVTFNS